MDDFDLLADARPARPPAAETIAAARSRLLGIIAAEQSPGRASAPWAGVTFRLPARRSRVLGWSLIPAVVAGIALLLGLVYVPGDRTPGSEGTAAIEGDAGPPPPLPLRHLLLAAAENSLQDSDSGGRYWVNKIESGQLIQVGRPDNRYAIMGRTEETTWYSTRATDRARYYRQWVGGAPASDADRAAWRRAGEPAGWPIDPPSTCPPRPDDDARRYTAGPGAIREVVAKPGVSRFMIAGPYWTATQVKQLPTDAVRLKAWLVETIRRDRPVNNGGELSRAIFNAMVNLLYQAPSTPAVRAAAYRVLADLPGLRSLGTVTDPKGRSGTAITVTTNEEEPGVRQADTGGPMEVRVIFDPSTGQPLAWETRRLRPVDYLSWVPTGALFDYHATLETRWTDDPQPRAADVRSEDAVEPITC